MFFAAERTMSIGRLALMLVHSAELRLLKRLLGMTVSAVVRWGVSLSSSSLSSPFSEKAPQGRGDGTMPILRCCRPPPKCDANSSV